MAMYQRQKLYVSLLIGREGSPLNMIVLHIIIAKLVKVHKFQV